jgi:hypothetical protein
MHNPHPNPHPEWLTEGGWGHVCELEGCDGAFAGLRASFAAHGGGWRAVVDAALPHEQVAIRIGVYFNRCSY